MLSDSLMSIMQTCDLEQYLPTSHQGICTAQTHLAKTEHTHTRTHTDSESFIYKRSIPDVEHSSTINTANVYLSQYVYYLSIYLFQSVHYISILVNSLVEFDI